MNSKLALASTLLVVSTSVVTSAAAQVAPPTWRYHHGLTVEAGIGIGSFRGSDVPALRGGQQGLAGPDLGVGWFINRRLALGLRVSGVYHRAATGDFLSESFAGPSAQVWLTPYAWLGAGAGVGMAYDGGRAFGFALDGRIGLVFNRNTRHSINAALELSPTFAGDNIYTGFALVAGYQLL